MRTKFTVLACLILIGCCAKLMSAEPSPQDKTDNREISRLIGGLGNPGVKIVFPKQDDPYLVIPKSFDWESHQRLRTTIEELMKMGVTAFPALAEHVSDDRFCCFTVGPVDRPHTVGWICEQIIKGQIDVYP